MKLLLSGRCQVELHEATDSKDLKSEGNSSEEEHVASSHKGVRYMEVRGAQLLHSLRD